MTNNSDTSCSVRVLLKLILACLLLRIGMDYTSFGKTEGGELIGVVCLCSGIGMVLWLVIASFILPFFIKLAETADKEGNPPS